MLYGRTEVDEDSTGIDGGLGGLHKKKCRIDVNCIEVLVGDW